MKFFDVLRGRFNNIEQEVANRVGEMPNVVEAHDKLMRARHNFYDAVAGVVQENEELRRRVHAKKTS